MNIDPRSMQKMAEELKLALAGSAASPGKVEQKMPWYTTAAGGLLGSAAGGALAGKYLPKKYKLLGQLGGALAGTAVGLEGGEALGRMVDQKLAAAETKPESPVRVLGKSLLGMGAGMGAGVLIPKGIDAAVTAVRGRPIMPQSAATIAPLVGGALGLAAPLLQYATLQKMREQHVKKQEVQGERQGT